MNCAVPNLDTSPDRIRYVLARVNRAGVSWTGRELFFLVKQFFPTETRSAVRAAASSLCSAGEFSISGRRYQTKAPEPPKAERVAVAHAK